jgi:hypothetical protein
MRHVLIVPAIVLATLAGVQPGRAGPFCMMTSVYLGLPDCSYQTWAQCRANLGGLGDYCYTNSLGGYVFDVSDPANPRVVTSKPRRNARTRR